MGPKAGPPDTSSTPTQSAQGLNIVSPTNGADVDSPMKIQVQANLPNPVDHAQVFVDGTAVYWGKTPFNTLIWMNPGQHKVDVTATDVQGGKTTSTVNVTARSQAPGLSELQNLPYWNFCTAKIEPPDPRAGQICASGYGNATSTMTPNQRTPSRSGSSAEFTLSGPTGYSNALWWNSLGGGASVSHFSYDVYVYIDRPLAPQSLEFDVNQTIDTTRYIFGTQCNFQGSHAWDVFDAVQKQWVATSAPCPPFPANQWVHIVWNFERANGMSRFVSVQVDNNVYPINIDMAPELDWQQQDIDVAFQLDGDPAQDPYNVWIDNWVLRVN